MIIFLQQHLRGCKMIFLASSSPQICTQPVHRRLENSSLPMEIFCHGHLSPFNGVLMYSGCIICMDTMRTLGHVLSSYLNWLPLCIKSSDTDAVPQLRVLHSSKKIWYWSIDPLPTWPTQGGEEMGGLYPNWQALGNISYRSCSHKSWRDLN